MTLRGRLPTYYLKQLAQHLIAEIKGVRRIINEIEVLALSGRELDISLNNQEERSVAPGAHDGHQADLGPVAYPRPAVAVM